MTCAKVIVKCKITTLDSQVFIGENNCNNPQDICPRSDTDNYDKCINICQQEAHAEIMAIKAAGDISLIGAEAEITGHYNVCKNCARALREVGISRFTVIISQNS